MYDRPPFPDSGAAEGFDPDESPPEWAHCYSYRHFFLECRGKEMTYDVETEGPREDEEWYPEEADEADEMEPAGTPKGSMTVKGSAVAGCAVGLSCIAAFAVGELSTFDRFEDGSQSEPDLFRSVFDPETDAPIEFAHHLEEILGVRAFKRLLAFRERVVKRVKLSGIRVLPEEELKKRVRFLRPAEGVILVDDRATVRTALFFWEM